LRARDDVQIPAAVKRERRLGEKLESPADVTLRASNPFADRIDLSAQAREEREDLVRLAEIARA